MFLLSTIRGYDCEVTSSLTTVIAVPAGRLCPVTVDGRRRRSNERWTAIADELLADIREGRLAVGDKFPSYSEFRERWGLGRKAAAKVVDYFVSLRAIEVTPYSGTTIVAIPVEGPDPTPVPVARVILDRLDRHDGRMDGHDAELADLRARLARLERGE